MTEAVPAGSDVRLGPASLPPHPPLLAAVRAALGDATAVVVGLAVDGGAARDVLGLLPVVDDTAGTTHPRPEEVADRLGPSLPADVDLVVAGFELPVAVAAVQVAPPVGGSTVERLLAAAASSAAGTARLWAELGRHQVWVPVPDPDAVPTRPALGGALEVGVVPPDTALPELPLLDRDGHAAVHVFTGVWQLLHADPPFPAAVRTTLDRVAATMSPTAALAIDVGCLHATLLAPGPA